MFDSICVVCVGNICRSPIGERLLKKDFPEKKISSAGISAVVGDSAFCKSESVAEQNGLSLDGHIARQLTRKICAEQDLILVMEKSHMKPFVVLPRKCAVRLCYMGIGLMKWKSLILMVVILNYLKKHIFN